MIDNVNPITFVMMKTGQNRGILLMNLGSPDTTAVKDVRKYLNEFLMDKRVIDLPWLSRFLLVRGLITPFRAKESAKAYKTIWTDKGSPLIELTRQLQRSLQDKVEEPVEIAMRYRKPNPEEAFKKLLQKNPQLSEVIAVPLYPHYAMSSYETAVEQVKQIHKKNNYSFSLKFVRPYYNHPDYIHALGESIRHYLENEYDHILFSYHGLPQRHLRKSDPTGNHCLQSGNCCEVPSPAHNFCYRHQCLTTTRLVTEYLNIPGRNFSISFQSRLGKGWLEPFTDIRLSELPGEGIKKLLILCPAFVSDCLETLEEIEERGHETFINAGGESYQMIPCLNVHPLWVKALQNIISEVDNSILENVPLH